MKAEIIHLSWAALSIEVFKIGKTNMRGETRESPATLSTRSLWASAYLLFQGHHLIGFEMITPHNGYFLFAKNPQSEADLENFYKNPSVPIRDYLSQYNGLRTVVMGAKRAAQNSKEEAI